MMKSVFCKSAFVILHCFGLLLCYVSADSERLSYMKDVDFISLRNSDANIAVFLHDKSGASEEDVQKVLNSINKSVTELPELNLKLSLVDCGRSKIVQCKRKERLNHALLFRAGEILGVCSGQDLQTPLQSKALLKHHFYLEGMIEISDRAEYEKIQLRNIGSKDIVVFYVPALGTEEHLHMIENSLTVPDSIVKCYTTNPNLMDKQEGISAWSLSCVNATENSCDIVRWTSDLSEENFFESFLQTDRITNYNEEGKDFFDWVKIQTQNGFDVLLLLPGVGKNETALAVANHIASMAPRNIHFIIVDSRKLDISDEFFSKRVEDSKIFLAITKANSAGRINWLDIGYLESEDPEYVMDVFNNALNDMKAQEDSYVPEAEEENTEQKTDSNSTFRNSEQKAILEDPPTPEEIQDDPVVHSFHTSKVFRDLYYFDFKTIPRLTDKTYVEVTQSKDYAVILVTLEFNVRSLVTLTNFVDIHSRLKAKGNSPLYRLECYNWPDVCEKAGVVATPRMFFYPEGSSERIEYRGMWDQKSMEEAIVRFSLPTVLVWNKPDDISKYEPNWGKALIGMFESDDGTSEFHKVAETMKEEIQFIEVHKGAASIVTEQFRKKFKHRALIALEDAKVIGEGATFASEKDINQFIEDAFIQPFQEMTVRNFVDVLGDDKPLLIYFWDKTDESIVTNEVPQILEKMSPRRVTMKVRLTWMDASPDTTGEFVIHRYNQKSKLAAPLVAFFDKKGSVILKSCASDSCDEASISSWLQGCIEGRIEATYSLSTEPWKPRLAGFDFLEKMKEEGTYPVPRKVPSLHSDTNEDSENETTKPVHGGRIHAMASKLQKAKMSRNEESPGKEDKMPNLADSAKHSTHTEL